MSKARISVFDNPREVHPTRKGNYQIKRELNKRRVGPKYTKAGPIIRTIRIADSLELRSYILEIIKKGDRPYARAATYWTKQLTKPETPGFKKTRKKVFKYFKKKQSIDIRGLDIKAKKLK